MNKLDPGIKTVWAIHTILRTIFYAVVVFFIEFFFLRNNLPNWDFIPGTLAVSIFMFGFIMTFIYPWLGYKYWAFEVREKELYLKRGILNRIYTTAPYSRVQHIDVQQSFIERTMHLGRLVIYTAGTRGADVTVPGLPIEYAEELRDQLKNITSEDAV